jgi:hypothetical protein
VNKLGDPSRKLASDAAFLLGQLLLQHPAMKAVVVREVSWQHQLQCFGEVESQTFVVGSPALKCNVL